jgi:superfamily I DNA and/or RNA helicase
MHPLLGRFVSRIFYEPHNDACIEPGRAEEEFQHDLPGFEGKVAGWIDVPWTPKHQETRGRSKSRPAEASRLAQELRRLVEAAPEFTFGVITFYAAQVQAIWRALADPGVGLAEEQEDGSYHIGSAFQGSGEERIRVGTVDAFQGVEFDVVFLSLTRSNTLAGDGEIARRRKYGHLLLENRLCVAMSRQKRLLVVFGDQAMIRDEAVEGLRPLVFFDRELCGGPHGVRI